MRPLRIACIGHGKMGRAVAALAAEAGHQVAGIVDVQGNAGGEGIDRATLGDPDVAIEFTEPSAALANALACVRAGIPVVIGTTGWYESVPLLAREVQARNGSALYAPNFALGVAMMREIAAFAARLAAQTGGFDVHLTETHHRAKRDAPSGTAAALADAMQAASGREVPITSIRVGSVPGTHEIIFDAQFEQVRLVHEARDRRVFATGAVAAAAWLVGRRGLFTLHDMLGHREEA